MQLNEKALAIIETVETNIEESFPVNLRDLWEALKSKRQYADWVKDRIELFEQGVDYEVFHKSIKNPTGGRPRKEYYSTVDVAKEISMLERNEIGRAIRRGLIEVEKRYLVMVRPLPDIPSYQIEDDELRALKMLK
jgi:phage anti-repressor protein